MISIKNLTHKFGETVVLDNINITFEDGKIYGLIGINGAGKSTLMRIISNVYKPTAGEVYIDGEVIDSNSKKKELLFFLPDDPFYSLNATANSLAKMYKMFYPLFSDMLFSSYISRFSLDPKQKVIHYSKGMRRKLFLSLAIACRVKYLLLDEAFDGLDPLARIEFIQFLLEVYETNPMTVIISSHSLRDLEDIIDNYVVLDHQKVLASGKVMESFENYAKYQLAYTSKIEESKFAKLYPTELKIVGKIVQIVVKRSLENEEELKKTNPVMMEELDMDFNDYFTNLVHERSEH